MAEHKSIHKDLQRLAKRANQRMRQLEQSKTMDAHSSPAYEGVQARLEMMGIKSTGAVGRRFPEKTKYTWNEYQAMKAQIEKFLNAETSTVRGFKKNLDNIWESANANNELAENGISKDDYFEIFKNLPAKHKDRMLSSDQYFSIVNAVQLKQKEMKDENKMSVAEIMEAISAKDNVKDAYKAVGLTFEEFSSSSFFEE